MPHFIRFIAVAILSVISTVSALAQAPPAVRDDTNRNFTHNSLSGEIIPLLRGAVQNRQVVNSPLKGPGFASFSEVPPKGALVIGFEFGSGRFVNLGTFNGVRAIYLTPQGKVPGKWFGPPSLGPVLHIEARSGYAVADVKLKQGLFIEGITVVFMAIGRTGLDAGDTYESVRYGQVDRMPLRNYVPNEMFVVGIHGRISQDGDVDDLGVVTLPKP